MAKSSTLRRPKQKPGSSTKLTSNTTTPNMISYQCDGKPCTALRRCRTYTMNGSIRHVWISPDIPTPKSINQYPSVWGDKQNNNADTSSSAVLTYNSGSSETAARSRSGSNTNSINSQHSENTKQRGNMGEKNKDKPTSSKLSNVVM